MELARTAIESVTVTIDTTASPINPPSVAIGVGTASPGPDAQWVQAAWSEPGTEATFQLAGIDAPETAALRTKALGHNYVYVRFGTVIRKAEGVVEVR